MEFFITAIMGFVAIRLSFYYADPGWRTAYQHNRCGYITEYKFTNSECCSKCGVTSDAHKDWKLLKRKRNLIWGWTYADEQL